MSAKSDKPSKLCINSACKGDCQLYHLKVNQGAAKCTTAFNCRVPDCKLAHPDIDQCIVWVNSLKKRAEQKRAQTIHPQAMNAQLSKQQLVSRIAETIAVCRTVGITDVDTIAAAISKVSIQEKKAPSCKFGARCTRSDCHFRHPESRTITKEMPTDHVRPKIMCRYGVNCHKRDCTFAHPAPAAAAKTASV